MVEKENDVKKLRFLGEDGEFYPEWVSSNLEESLELLKDGTHGSHKEYKESNIFLLSAKNIKNNKIVISDDDRRISLSDYKKMYSNWSLEKGDVLLTVVGTIGRAAIVESPKNLAFQRSVAILRVKQSILHNHYLHAYLQSNKTQKTLDSKKVVSAQAGIYLGTLSKISIPIPSLIEQTKIAELLSKIDEKIEAQAKLIELRKKEKQGYMQRILGGGGNIGA